MRRWSRSPFRCRGPATRKRTSGRSSRPSTRPAWVAAKVLAAADLLQGWKDHLPAWGAEAPPGLTDLRRDFGQTAGERLRAWAAGRIADHRFAHAHEGLSAFAASASVKALFGPTAPAELEKALRSEVRDAEDEYHYTQIRTLAAADPVPEERLKQHIDAYLALVEPPGASSRKCRQLADYRKWLKDGRPMKALVTITWGPRSVAREHTIEIGLGASKDGQPLHTFTRTATAGQGKVWTDTFAVTGLAETAGRIPYRVKTVRPTSPVEELAEAARERTELFVSDASGSPRRNGKRDAGHGRLAGPARQARAAALGRIEVAAAARYAPQGDPVNKLTPLPDRRSPSWRSWSAGPGPRGSCATGPRACPGRTRSGPSTTALVARLGGDEPAVRDELNWLISSASARLGADDRTEVNGLTRECLDPACPARDWARPRVHRPGRPRGGVAVPLRQRRPPGPADGPRRREPVAGSRAGRSVERWRTSGPSSGWSASRRTGA